MQYTFKRNELLIRFTPQVAIEGLILFSSNSCVGFENYKLTRRQGDSIIIFKESVWNSALIKSFL